MADILTKYPSTSSVALTIALHTGPLASDTNLLAGRASTAVDNRTNQDIDHLLSGVITTGTSPTVSTTIELWLYAPRSISSGTPTYPDGITGTDANKTITSLNVKNRLVRLDPIIVDNTTARGYDIGTISIAAQFGGSLPPFWGLFVVHNTGVALNSTAGNHVIHYTRIQNQSV